MKTCILCGGMSNRTIYTDERMTVIQCLACNLVRQQNYKAALAKSSMAVDGKEYYKVNRSKVVPNSLKKMRTKDIQRKIVEDFRPTTPVLDVGCGNGEFMQALHELGLSAIGVEPNVQKTAYVQEKSGLEVVTSSYQKDLFAPDSFDVVAFIQVLEHVEDPVETLKIARHHLCSDGYLVVDVPGYNNPRFLLYKLTRQKYFTRRDFIPTHNYYYTRRTLSQIAEAAGFRVLDVVTGRYGIKYGHKHKLLKMGLWPVDKLANLLGIGGITLYAQKASMA